MVASDADLGILLTDAELVVTPAPTADLIQPASIDIHLDRFFRRYNPEAGYIDFAEDQPNLTLPFEVPEGEYFELAPGEFALGAVLEHVAVGNTLCVQVDGRSSVGRGGLLVHATAGFVDPGFAGHITLELTNLNRLPMRLWPGMRLGQLIVHPLNSRARRPYGSEDRGSHYMNQPRGPVPGATHRTWAVRDAYDRAGAQLS